jgi:hypothetical protein
LFKENKPYDVSPYDHPDIYPGPRLASSFIYYQGKAHRILEVENVKVEHLSVAISEANHLLGSFLYSSSNVIEINKFLEKEQMALMQERVPVLAYGSNVCLAQLKYKFNLNPQMCDLVIVLRATIQDSDIIYGSFLAPYGSLPAVIAPVKGAKVEVWITFLDKKQLEFMHRTEKGYEFMVHDGKKVTLATGEIFDNVYAYYYPSGFKWKNTFYRFPDINGQSSLPEIWQADMLNLVKKIVDYEGSREEFIHLIRWDVGFHEQVAAKLSQHSTYFKHPDWKVAKEVCMLKDIYRRFGY